MVQSCRDQQTVQESFLEDVIQSGADKGTGYIAGDNQSDTGYLNNGKPITEENVLALPGGSIVKAFQKK